MAWCTASSWNLRVFSCLSIAVFQSLFLSALWITFCIWFSGREREMGGNVLSVLGWKLPMGVVLVSGLGRG